MKRNKPIIKWTLIIVIIACFIGWRAYQNHVAEQRETLYRQSELYMIDAIRQSLVVSTFQLEASFVFYTENGMRLEVDKLPEHRGSRALFQFYLTEQLRTLDLEYPIISFTYELGLTAEAEEIVNNMNISIAYLTENPSNDGEVYFSHEPEGIRLNLFARGNFFYGLSYPLSTEYLLDDERGAQMVSLFSEFDSWRLWPWNLGIE